MSHLRLSVMAISEIREIFGANSEFSDKLRDLAIQKFFSKNINKKKLISSLFRRKTGVVTGEDIPVLDDIEILLSGHHIPADRAATCWQIFVYWISELSLKEITLEISGTQWEQLEFDLVLNGVHSQYALRSMLASRARIPFPRLAGIEYGYSKYSHVTAVYESYKAVFQKLSSSNQALATEIIDFLSDCDTWQQQALAAGRLRPDIFGCLTML